MTSIQQAVYTYVGAYLNDELIPSFLAFAVVCGSSILFSVVFRLLGWWPKCTKSGSRQSDIVSFEIVAFGCCLYLGIAGVVAYFSLFGVESGPSPGQDGVHPLYRRHPYSDRHLYGIMLAYQLWNTIICACLHELRSPAMILHHLVSAYGSYLGIVTPYAHKFAVYFSGISEISSAVLSFVVHFHYFPEQLELKPLATVNFVASIAFAISYLVFRVILWPLNSITFWQDHWDLFTGTGSAYSNDLDNTQTAYIFLVFHFVLTGLQLYWAVQIFEGFLKLVSPSSGDKTKDE